MGYVSWKINQDVPFSQAIYQAISKGHTESDFRRDLDGLDSARKAVIIGRTGGYPLELTDIEVEKLLPPEMKDVSIEEATKMLPMVDEKMKSRVEIAKRNGCTLRYVGELDFDKGAFKIGFSEIPADDPQSSVKESWNKVTIFPRYWKGESLTIEGPGAGINVTTQGLMTGLYDLSNHDFSK
jgi:aspartokinase/homoserine dehydrogenase 1